MLSWDVRIDRLTRAAAILRDQLPFLEPGRSARAQMTELLGTVESTLEEVKRRRAMRRRQDLRDIASRIAQTSSPRVPQPRKAAIIVRSVDRAPLLNNCTLALPASAGRRVVREVLEYEVVWPRQRLAS